MVVAALIVEKHLAQLQRRDMKDLAKALGMSQGGRVRRGVHPHAGPAAGPALQPEQTRLIEPDVVFLKRGGEWVVCMNEETCRACA